MKTNIRSITLFIVFLLSLTFSLNASSDEADDKEIKNMQQQITELENRIKDLEQIIKIYHDPKDQEKEIAYGWLNKKNWRNLKKGMTQEEVKKILGEPVKSVDGSRLIWYYPNFYQSYVSFDEKGSLIGWNEP
ncbi:MAG: outer membrane protein assembly factor BamE [Deltaproteobacteria bacterium]|nr:outer membrane protein assembly factor BamE [Deltaproteobacteria bacterium]